MLVLAIARLRRTAHRQDLFARVVPVPLVSQSTLNNAPWIPITFEFTLFRTRGALTDSVIDACTCEKAADGGVYPDEVDFTTQK